ncbi:efflux RND transporter periplasmic adaptor subunit [Flammeovirga agarivorans]|uniref:Efflux RND transporter periplasmic adaptor subunit n=1 Tax=Flammeovirga agarivorans TaxID=2726742 RepID=A0A7X8XW15_9BACT|nr:efflux RND transporter periplasmic adaptor subunit [Flammeovirga agarivorans]NLR91816.1 efflux RND transporter periplasmic adaptor subunit [Flammeovirga agarivorans]
MNKKSSIFKYFLPLLFLIGCSEEEQTKKEVIRPVKLLTVQSNNASVDKTFPAITKETKASILSFRVGGPLVKLNAEVGQKIKKGQLIAEIDDRDFIVELQAKKAKYIQAEAEKNRYEGLLKKQSIPQNEYDQKLAAFLIAQSNYEDAQNALKDTKIYSPFDAVVSEKMVENFQEVRAKQGIASLLDFSDTEVKFYIPESFVRYIDQVESFDVRVNAYPNTTFKAVIKEVGAKAEGASGFPVYLYLTDLQKIKNDFPIGAGMSCKVDMHFNDYSVKENIFLIPIHSIVQSKNKNVVMTYDKTSHTVKTKDIQIGALSGTNQIQVLGGLQNGEQIVEYGGNLLQNGQKVRVLDFNPTTSKIAKQ